MIYVDADACPVKAEAERVATRHKMQMALVSNGGLRMSQNPFVDVVIVPEGPDVADMWIADRAGPKDIVVTGDIPLAARCVEACGFHGFDDDDQKDRDHNLPPDAKAAEAADNQGSKAKERANGA